MAGRPPFTLGAKELRQIEALAGYGLTEAAIAHVLGCAPSTFRAKKKTAEQVAAAMARGKAKAEGIVGKALFKKAKGGDIPAVRWWEMTRAGRSERNASGLTGTVDLSTFSDAQLGALADGVDLARVLAMGRDTPGRDSAR